MDRFYWNYVNPRDPDNEIEVTRSSGYSPDPDGWITVTVSDEKAVDSYNQTFSCSIMLSDDVARALLDHLTTLLEAKADK